MARRHALRMLFETVKFHLKIPSRETWISWGKEAYQLGNETLDEYAKDRGEMVAAGLAFFTLLSMAPLIIIAVAIAGQVLGRGTAESAVQRLVRDTMGNSAADTVGGWVQEASESGAIASIIGFALMLFTASRLGAQLRVGLNQVWNVDETLAESFKETVHDYVKRRLFAFLLVLASGPILLVVFASRALLTGLRDVVFAETPIAGLAVQLSQLAFSLVLVAVMSAVVFKVVPDTRIGWKAVTRGAILTSVLFNLGNWLVGLYLGRAPLRPRAQPRGRAGACGGRASRKARQRAAGAGPRLEAAAWWTACAARALRCSRTKAQPPTR